MKRTQLALVLAAFLFVIQSLTGQTNAQELRFLVVGHTAPLNNYINDHVIPAFEEKHGVKVFMDTATWTNRVDKILVAVAGGVPYDVVATGYYSPYEEGANGLLAPLDLYVSRWDKRDFFPETLWEATKWEGKIYHIPHNNDVRGIGYNRHLFAESGFDPDQPPESWQELIDAARRLTRMEGNQVGVRGFNVMNAAGAAAQELFWFMHQAGVSEINTTDFTSNLNTPEARDAMRTLAQLAEVSRFGEAAIGGGFNGGRVAMQRNTPFNLSSLLQHNPDMIDDYGLFAPRRSPNDAPVAHNFVNGLGILEASRNKDLAWELIATLHDDDIRFEIERISGFISGRTDLILPMMDVVPKIDLFYQLFSHLKATVIPPPRNVSQTDIGNRVIDVYRGNIPPETALLQSDELWVRLLQDWQQELEAAQ